MNAPAEPSRLQAGAPVTGQGWGEEALATIPPNFIGKWYELCDAHSGKDTPWAARMKPTWTAMLKGDPVGEGIAAARRRLDDLAQPPENPLAKQIACFEHHQDKLRSQTYRAQGLFYGSGVSEGG